MKQLKIIDASITKQQAFDILEQHELDAVFYRVPQGDDKELAEAMRLLSGLGYLIKHQSNDHLVGSFIKPSVSTDTNSESDKTFESNIIQLFFDKHP